MLDWEGMSLASAALTATSSRSFSNAAGSLTVPGPLSAAISRLQTLIQLWVGCRVMFDRRASAGAPGGTC